MDNYAAAVVNDEGRTASGYSAAAEPIQHKVSDLSVILEHQSHIVSYNAVITWLFHTVNSCFCLDAFPVMYSVCWCCSKLECALRQHNLCTQHRNHALNAWHMSLQSCLKVHFADHTLMCFLILQSTHQQLRHSLARQQLDTAAAAKAKPLRRSEVAGIVCS